MLEQIVVGNGDPAVARPSERSTGDRSMQVFEYAVAAIAVVAAVILSFLH